MTKRAQAGGLLLVGLAWFIPALADPVDAPRANRHALIIGVGNYQDQRVPALKGVVHDVANARQMAQSMGVPEANMRVLQDQDATNANIRNELKELGRKVREGDRVFVYYSGHGTRYASPENPNVCREAVIPSDVDLRSKAGFLTQEDIAAELAPAYAKADKVFVFFDACFSGGMRTVTRAAAGKPTDDLMPKFTSLGSPAHCRKPSNVRTRSLNEAARSKGAPANNVVQVSSSRPDEISLDSPSTGGLATSSWRYCMTYAEDTDGSGALSVAEISACVQRRIDSRLATSDRYTGQHLVILGNKDFAPIQPKPLIALPGATREVSAAPAAVPQEKVRQDVSSQAATGSPSGHPSPPALFPLESVIAQSDARHQVTVRHPTAPLRIGRDYFDLEVKSSRGGFVYLVLQSSDRKSTHVIFPNALDQDNRIKPGEWLRLPRANWKLLSRGPAGVNRLLVMVADAPRDLTLLRAHAEGPFVKTLNDRSAARALAWVVGSATGSASSRCASEMAAKDLVYAEECSDSFGARIVEFTER